MDGTSALRALFKSKSADGRAKRDRLRTEHLSGNKRASDKILAVRVDGVIVGEKPENKFPGFMGMSFTSGYEVQELLLKAAKDETIKAVVVQLSTPGGTINGAQAISDSISEYRQKTGKPVVAHIEGMSASGGVYAMVAADAVYAEPGSLVGSIGVTLGQHKWFKDPMSVSSGLLTGGVETTGGVHTRALIAGKGKDLLSPWREPTTEEVTTIQRQLDTLYADFVSLVATQRKIDPEVIEHLMGAYIFANTEATSLGLIDGTMTRRRVFEHVATRAGLKDDEYSIVEERVSKPGLLIRLFKGESPTEGAEVGTPACALQGVLALYTGGFF